MSAGHLCETPRLWGCHRIAKLETHRVTIARMLTGSISHIELVRRSQSACRGLVCPRAKVLGCISGGENLMRLPMLRRTMMVSTLLASKQAGDMPSVSFRLPASLVQLVPRRRWALFSLSNANAPGKLQGEPNQQHPNFDLVIFFHPCVLFLILRVSCVPGH